MPQKLSDSHFLCFILCRIMREKRNIEVQLEIVTNIFIAQFVEKARSD